MPDAPSSYVVITNRASARRGICFCRRPLTSHSRVILSEPAGRVEGPLSWKRSTIRGWTIFAAHPGWYCGPSRPRRHWPRNRARLQPCRMRLLPMLSSRGGLQPDEGSAFASHRSPAPTCHPERARRASRRTPIVEEIDDSRLDYFRGRTPTGTAGLQAGVSIGLASGHGFTVC